MADPFPLIGYWEHGPWHCLNHGNRQNTLFILNKWILSQTCLSWILVEGAIWEVKVRVNGEASGGAGLQVWGNDAQPSLCLERLPELKNKLIPRFCHQILKIRKCPIMYMFFKVKVPWWLWYWEGWEAVEIIIQRAGWPIGTPAHSDLKRV